MLFFKKSLRTIIFLGLSFTALSAVSGPVNFDAMYVFGDSISDNGNDFQLFSDTFPFPDPANYFNGRFSNGQVWVEYLAEDLGLNLQASEGGFNLANGESVNFAYGGATTGTGAFQLIPGFGPGIPNMLSQLDQYQAALDGNTANPNALNIIYGGHNDYNPAIGAITYPSIPIENIETMVTTLYNSGARNFLLPTLLSFSNFSDEHNLLLAKLILDLSQSLADVVIYSQDINSLEQSIVADPGSFGFTSELGPVSACQIPPFTCTVNSFETQAINWDLIHPSTAFHELIANQTLENLSVPEPGSLTLMLAALLGLWVFNRRSLAQMGAG